jgi:hypothetical protein
VKRLLVFAPVIVAALVLLPGETGLLAQAIGVPMPDAIRRAIEAVRLDARDFWGDEIGTVLAAQEPLARILNGRALDFHPPLYYLLMHFWIRGFGSDEAVVRVPSVLFGLLLIVVLVRFAQETVGARAWRWAGAFAAVYPPLIMFSRMARYYSMVGFLAALSCLFFWRMLRRFSWRHMIYYVLAGLGLAYTNYLALGLLASQLVVGLIWGSSRRRWVLTGVVIVAGYAPWVGVAFAQAGALAGRGEVATAVSGLGGLASRVAYPLYALSLGETVFPWRLWVVAPALPLVATLAVAGLIQSRREAIRAGVVVACTFVLAVVVASTVARAVPPVYLPSRMLFLAPVLLLVLALGVKHLGTWGRPAGCLVIAVWCYSVSNYYRGSDFHNPVYLIPWRQIVAELRSSLEPGDGIVATPEYPFLFYKGDDMEVLLLHGDSVERVQRRVMAMEWPRLWVLTRERADPLVSSAPGPFWYWLSLRYSRVSTWNYVGEDPRSVRLKRALLRRPVNASSLSLALFVKRSEEGSGP